MKILILNSYYDKGGAARAAVRLADSLERTGIDVEYKSIYPKKLKTSEKINLLYRVSFDRLPGLFSAKKRVMFSSGKPNNTNIVKYINDSEADLVHLHWMNAGGLSIEDISNIAKPIVWTMHDNWVFTGGCHVMWDCERYKLSCGKCPILNSDKSNDLSRKVAQRKKVHYSKLSNVTFVGVSNWIAECARSSDLLKNQNVAHLPNPLNTELFRPTNKRSARDLLDLPADKKLILFGASSATKDINKGYSILKKALDHIPQDTQIELVVFGNGQKETNDILGFKTHYFGHISDDETLVSLYCSADVMVVPSIQESFGQTAAEAMACATPVVAFGATGLLDIVDHKKNGYLAKAYDSKSLAEGILWVLNSIHHEQLCTNARLKVLDSFESRVVAKKYIALYSSIIESVKHKVQD
ncbi:MULTISPECIES: glycosyltransferase family 4 protein [Pseudomonas]|uniref:glycosyltransferase family 4 protein n=1 Tax=Pseudomonas TaxID=286 RepID=UPI000BA26E6C|nr:MULTISPECIES: glycosyltransferase family 4 protein [Pseudomonas]PAA23217.1 hypothetical protein CJU72_16705 [Pseudomonas fragi]